MLCAPQTPRLISWFFQTPLAAPIHPEQRWDLRKSPCPHILETLMLLRSGIQKRLFLSVNCRWKLIANSSVPWKGHVDFCSQNVLGQLQCTVSHRPARKAHELQRVSDPSLVCVVLQSQLLVMQPKIWSFIQLKCMLLAWAVKHDCYNLYAMFSQVWGCICGCMFQK